MAHLFQLALLFNRIMSLNVYYVHEYVQIFVENIKIFIEMLRIQKQCVQNLRSEGSTQTVISIHHIISASFWR